MIGRLPFFRTDLRIEAADEPELVLDARRLLFVSPLELTAVAAMAQRAALEARPVRFVLPDDPDLASYLRRMDLLKHLDGIARVEGVIPEEDRSDRSDVLLELTRIEQPHEADELAERIVPLARGRSTAAVTSAVFSGLGEFLDNACTHGESPIGVFAAAQAYTGETSGKRGLELAVADAGVGILEHLRGNPSYARFRRPVTAIRYAIRAGVSGTRDRRGYGFHDVLQEVRKAGLGRIVLRSGNGIARVTVRPGGRSQTFRESRFSVQGTWLWLRVRIP